MIDRKQQTKRALVLGLGIAMSLSAVTGVSAKTTVGAGISIGKDAIFSPVTGVGIGIGGSAHAGVGNMKGSGSDTYGVIGVSVASSEQAKAKLQQKANATSLGVLKETKQSDWYEMPTEKALEDTIIYVTSADKKVKGRAIYNGLGDELADFHKNQYAFTIRRAQGTNSIVTAREDKGELTITNHSTGQSFTVRGNYATGDGADIVVYQGEKAMLYSKDGKALWQEPVKRYEPLNSADYGMVVNPSKGKQLVRKADGSLVSKNFYPSLIQVDGEATPYVVLSLGDGYFKLEALDASGRTADQALREDGMDKTPKTVGLAKHVVTKVVAPLSEGVAIVEYDKKQHGVNEAGEELFTLPSGEYDMIYPYHNGLAMAQRKVHSFGLGGLLRTALSLYSGVIYTQDSYRWVESKRKFDYLDKAGNVVISSKEYRVSPAMGNYIYVNKDGKYGIYSSSGELLIPAKYTTLLLYGNPSGDSEKDVFEAQVNKGEAYGVIDRHGNTVLPFDYDRVMARDLHTMVLRKGEATYTYNLDSRKLSGPYVAVFGPNFYDDFVMGGGAPFLLPRLVVETEDHTFRVLNPYTGELGATLSVDSIVAVGSTYFVGEEQGLAYAYRYDGTRITKQGGRSVY